MPLPLLRQLISATRNSLGAKIIYGSTPSLSTAKRYCSAGVGANWFVDPCIDFRELITNFDAITPRVNNAVSAVSGVEILANLKFLLNEYEAVSRTVGELERTKERNIADFSSAASSQDSKLRLQYAETGKLIKNELKIAYARKRDLYQTLLKAALELPNRLHPLTPSALAVGCSPGTLQSTASECGDFQTQFYDGREANNELRLLYNCCRYLERVGFQLVAPPDFLRADVLSAAGLLAAETSLFTLLTKSELHKLKANDHETHAAEERARKGEDNDAYLLVGPSALSLSAYLMRTTVPKSKTPVKLVCSGRQHLRCSGALDAAGFQKASRVSVLVGAASSDELDSLFAELQDTVLQFISSLRIPVHCRKLCADELAKHEAARWIVTTAGPTRNFVLASLSYHYDYVSRRLMTEVKVTSSSGPAYLHTVSGYVLDVSKCLNLVECNCD